LVPLRTFRDQSSPSKLHRAVGDAITAVENAFGRGSGV
jgi:hypothetical protein